MDIKILYLLIILTSYSFSQEVKKSDVIGTWELLETVSLSNQNIDIGELVLENEDGKPKYDSIKKIIEKRKKKDPRITKWHYIIGEKYLFEYRFEYGSKFKSKIINNSIYKFDEPFYRIESINGDTLKLMEYKSDDILVLKKVNTDLSDFEILYEY